MSYYALCFFNLDLQWVLRNKRMKCFLMQKYLRMVVLRRLFQLRSSTLVRVMWNIAKDIDSDASLQEIIKLEKQKSHKIQVQIKQKC